MADQVVNIFFDARTLEMTIDPDRLQVPFGTQELYWTLTTINRPDPSTNAVFDDFLIPLGEAFSDFQWSLFSASVKDDNQQPGCQEFTYQIVVRFADRCLAFDPTIINLPDMAGGQDCSADNGRDYGPASESPSLPARAGSARRGSNQGSSNQREATP